MKRNEKNDKEKSTPDKEYIIKDTEDIVMQTVSALKDEMDISARKKSDTEWMITIKRTPDDEYPISFKLNKFYRREDKDFYIQKNIGMFRNLVLRANQADRLAREYKNWERLRENLLVGCVYDDDNGYCVFPAFATGIDHLTGLFYVKLGEERIQVSPNLISFLEEKGISFRKEDMGKIMSNTLVDNEYYFDDDRGCIIFVKDKLGVPSSLLFNIFVGIKDPLERFNEDLYITVCEDNSLIITKKEFFKKIGMPEGSKVGMIMSDALVIYYDHNKKDIKERLCKYDVE